MKNKRWLFITTLEATWGGSEWLWFETARELHRLGATVGFVLPWLKTGTPADELRQAGVASFSETPGPTRWWRRLGRRKCSRQERRGQILREWNPDLAVLSQTRQDAGAEWGRAFADARVPYIILNEVVTDDIWLSEETAETLVGLFNAARQVYFVSERCRTKLRIQLGIALPRSAVVRNPFGIPFDQPFAWPEGSALKLGIAARLDPNDKGQDLAMRVLAQDAWLDRPIELHCFGTGAGEKRLRRVSALLKLEHKVFFRGYAQPADIWRECQVAFMPSRQEGLPVALVEAMLMGRPAVVTDVGGNAEIVRDGVDGFVAEAAAVPAIAAALERMWSARARLPEMGARAQAHIRTQVPSSPAKAFAELLLEAAAKES